MHLWPIEVQRKGLRGHSDGGRSYIKESSLNRSDYVAGSPSMLALVSEDIEHGRSE